MDGGSISFSNDLIVLISIYDKGCDASILLDGSNTEKAAGANTGVGPFDLIDRCKTSLEQKCPGVVSCADIIVIATRVAVSLV